MTKVPIKATVQRTDLGFERKNHTILIPSLLQTDAIVFN